MEVVTPFVTDIHKNSDDGCVSIMFLGAVRSPVCHLLVFVRVVSKRKTNRGSRTDPV